MNPARAAEIQRLEADRAAAETRAREATARGDWAAGKAAIVEVERATAAIESARSRPEATNIVGRPKVHG